MMPTPTRPPTACRTRRWRTRATTPGSGRTAGTIARQRGPSLAAGRRVDEQRTRRPATVASIIPRVPPSSSASSARRRRRGGAAVGTAPAEPVTRELVDGVEDRGDAALRGDAAPSPRAPTPRIDPGDLATARARRAWTVPLPSNSSASNAGTPPTGRSVSARMVPETEARSPTLQADTALAPRSRLLARRSWASSSTSAAVTLVIIRRSRPPRRGGTESGIHPG